MADYGIRLTSGSNVLSLTPECATIISAGEKSMSDSLEGDNTYGEDVTISTSLIPEADIAVFIVPSIPTFSVINSRFTSGSTLYASSQYADDEATYYTRDTSTSVMTSWSAGNMTAGSRDTWDPILSIYPAVFWDKLGASTFTAVRLFAATCYFVYDTSASTKKIVYSIGSVGVPTIQYMVAIKNYAG